MKKRIFLAALLVAVFAFGTISCKKEDKERCWKISVKTDINLEDFKELGKLDAWYWGTEAAVNTQISAIESSLDFTLAKAAAEAAGHSLSIEKSEATKYTTQTDCMAQNVDL